MNKDKIISFTATLFVTVCSMTILFFLGTEVDTSTFFTCFFGAYLGGLLYDMVKK